MITMKIVSVLVVLLMFATFSVNSLMKYLNGNIKNLRMTNFNMGSGSNNLALVQYMVTYKLPDVFGVSETPLTQEIEDWVNTTDYNLETKSDNERVWVLIKCSVVYKRRYDLEPSNLPVTTYLTSRPHAGYKKFLCKA